MGNFLATPFMLVAQISLWVASLFTGTVFILMEVEEDQLDDDDQEY